MPTNLKKTGLGADTFVPTDDDPFGGITECVTVFEDSHNSLQRCTYESGYVRWDWFEGQFDEEEVSGFCWIMADCVDEPEWLDLPPLAQAALDSYLEAEAAQ